MNRGFKRLFLLILVTLMAVITACSSNQGTPSDDNGSNVQSSNNQGGSAAEDNDKPEQITISIFYPKPDEVEGRKQADEKIRRFNEVYPNVTIEKSDWHYNPDEIGIKMGAGEAPTLFNTYATEGRMLVERGWAADITAFFDKWEYYDQMNPVLTDQFMINDRIYGIPANGYVVATVVNKTLLEEKGVALPPYNWTWDDMFETASAVSDPDVGRSGIAPMGRGNESGWNWTNFLFLAGGDIQKMEDGRVLTAFNSQAGIDALEFYKDLRWKGNAIPEDWALDWGDAVGSFAQGRTAMVIAGADGPVGEALNVGGFEMDEILVYPMPAQTAGGKHTSVLGGNYLVVNPNATQAEQEAAFNFAVFDYFTDIGLEAMEADIRDRQESGAYFIPPIIQYFNDDSEYGKKVRAIYEAYDNVYKYDPEISALLDGKPEAPYLTQEYYGEMTNVIQEIFSNEDADVASLIEKAAHNVQTQYYDGIEE